MKFPLKQSKKKAKKNLVPPFNDPAWTVTTASQVKDISKTSRSIGFRATKYHGFNFHIPNPEMCAGKKISVSARLSGRVAGIAVFVESGGSTTTSTASDGLIEGLSIPQEVTGIRIKLQNHIDDGYVYFEDLQVEIGDESTDFEENILIDNKNVDKGQIVGRNLFPDSGTEKSATSREYLRHTDLAPIFHKYGLDKKYSLSLDLKSADVTNKDSIMVYMQNGNGTRYQFVLETVKVTTEYQRFKFEGLTPKLSMESEEHAYLSFYGTYDSGNFPIVKNIQIELGETATPYQPYRTQDNRLVKKGMEFDGDRQYITLENADIDEIEVDFIHHEKLKRYDTLMSLGLQEQNTPFLWIYNYEGTPYFNLQTTKIGGGYTGAVIGQVPLGVRSKIRVKISDDKVESYLNDESTSTSTGSFHMTSDSERKRLSIMTYSRSSSHSMKGRLYSVKAWKNGRLIIHYDLENKGNYKDVIIDLSGNGNDGIVNAGATPSVRKNRVEPRKAIRKYPFSFNRNTVEFLDGSYYQINQPRIKNGGVLIEEQSRNLFSDNIHAHGSSLEWTGGYYQGRKVFRNTIIKEGVGNNFGVKTLGTLPVTEGVSKRIILTTFIKMIKYGNVYSERIGKGYVRVNYSDGTQGTFSFRSDAYDFSLLNKWQEVRHEFTTPSTKTVVSIANAYIYEDYATDSEMLVTDWQLEEDYETSYSNGDRPNEILDIPVTIDGQGGSIEIVAEADFLDRGQYFFDTDRSRWLMYKAKDSSYLRVFLDGQNRLTFLKSLLNEGRNTILIEWDEISSRAYLNGVEVATGDHSGSSNATTIYIGRRHTNNEYLNGVVHSFTLKDRTGKTVFKL